MVKVIFVFIKFLFLEIRGMKMQELAIYKDEVKSEKQYVVFGIDKESFGLDVSYVNSIIQVPHITFIPQAPEHYSGVIDLRGAIVPVINLRSKMSYEDAELTHSSRIIITDLESDKQVGLIVDEVKEVVTIPDDEIMEPSPFLKDDESLISGVSNNDGDLISVFNLELLV